MASMAQVRRPLQRRAGTPLSMNPSSVASSKLLGTTSPTASTMAAQNRAVTGPTAPTSAKPAMPADPMSAKPPTAQPPTAGTQALSRGSPRTFSVSQNPVRRAPGAGGGPVQLRRVSGGAPVAPPIRSEHGGLRLSDLRGERSRSPVSDRVSEITAEDSPLMREAAARGRRAAAERGLLSSTMAVGAAEREVVGQASQLATADVQERRADLAQDTDVFRAGMELDELQQKRAALEDQLRKTTSEIEQAEIRTELDRNRVEIERSRVEVERQRAAADQTRAGAAVEQVAATRERNLQDAASRRDDLAFRERELGQQVSLEREELAFRERELGQQVSLERERIEAERGRIAAEVDRVRIEATRARTDEERLRADTALERIKTYQQSLSQQGYALAQEMQAILANTDLPASERTALLKAARTRHDRALAAIRRSIEARQFGSGWT